MSQVEREGSAPRTAFSGGYKSAVLSLLLLAYTFNFIDRTIIATIGQAIKVDLKVTDAQLGLLGGLYFALLYTFLGVPLARLAERRSRTWIITGSLVVWSGFTALCGAAANFGQLALLRFGVGVGEAGLSPSAHSLVSDYYPPRKRASALGVYSLGIPLGTMFGAVLGGWLAQDFSWRMAFVVVGLPGVLLALVFKWVVKEPARGASDAPVVPALAEDVAPEPSALAPSRVSGSMHTNLFVAGEVLAAVALLAAAVVFLLGGFRITSAIRGFAVAAVVGGVLMAVDGANRSPRTARSYVLALEMSELWSVAGTLFAKWPVVNMVMGITVASFASYGTNAFVPPYLVREYGLGLKMVGLITGVVAGVSAGAGTLIGGFLTDRLGRRSAVWYALVPAIGIAVAVPLYILGYNQPTWQRTALILLVPGVFHYTYLAPTFGVVQNSVDVRRRATATAILFFFLNLFALGGGPPFVGWAIDTLAGWNLAHPGAHPLSASARGLLGGGADFGRACPGGVAPKGSAPALAATCKAVLARSTQQGITLGAFFYAWASLHYLLAAIGMVKHMAGRAKV